MKKHVQIGLTSLLVLLMIALSACGSGGASEEKKEPEPFKLGEYTYKLGKIARSAEDDEGSMEAYKVSLMIEGDSAPILISGGVTKAGVEMELVTDDGTINYDVVSFSVIPEEEREDGFGAMAEYTFRMPKDSEFPKKANVIDGSDSSQEKEIDLSGVTIEE